MGNEALTISQMAHLKEDFSESILPFRVDIVDWASLSPDFQKIIKQSFIEIVYWVYSSFIFKSLTILFKVSC